MKTLLLLLMLVLTAGCGSTLAPIAAGATPTVIRNTSIKDFASFVSLLRQSGLSVSTEADVSQPFFSVPAHTLKLNGEPVQVFEYADEAAMQNDAAKVGGDGFHIANAIVDWVAPPHFYKQGRLIVLYVGQEPKTKSALDFALGPQFAGQENKSPTPAATP